MCLKINSDSFTEDTFKVAEEDISCYKVYCKRHQVEHWETPVFSVPAPQLEERRQSREAFNILGISVDRDMKTKSGIHTFAELRGAVMMILDNIQILTFRTKEIRQSVRIVRSIIPKGTKYLEGENSLGKAYSSEYLIDKEIVLQLVPKEIKTTFTELMEFIMEMK